MRALIQRVTEASVTVDGQITGEIGPGLLVLICAMQGDTEATSTRMAAKIARLRIFTDENDKMNLSVRDIGGSVLAVSQFTLAGDASRGNRPGFATAARPETAAPMYEHFKTALRTEGLSVEAGIFAADMKVRLLNDGPVTIWIDSADW
ncbi:D-aminoacyl-tRNA deacylase [Falsigemmobacter faecalis]|uniref:D-aminoacyl-tRNA deacylase n=1 Tax=Falsigemmobacter faecalis TaxID=2488730 RepID=A0A3P3DNP9_9RHOB|nr:D-aminoacyl-tRNA deacylase [Falsigemmobacter faecalis]RRH75869.1 D-tyrosyl-tRNA(Tyr) deacylase [Falsigemmobacter faecalis]